MSAPLMSWQSLLWPAIVCWGLAGIALTFAFLDRRHRQSRVEIRRLVAFAIFLLVLSAPFAWMAYRQYGAINTKAFSYTLELTPNQSAPDSIIVPIPGEEGLLGGLHVSSGTANWSLVDTVHGRGLLVNFSGAVSLEASFSQFASPETPFGHNVTPTMRENATEYQADVWVLHQGATGVQLGLWDGWWRICGPSCEYVNPTQGWRTYPMAVVPPP